MRVVWGLQEFWESAVAAVYHQDFAGDAVWSPCSRFIAIAKSASVAILDAVTLRQLNTLEFPQDSTPGKLGFSPDSRVLLQFSDGKVTRWDVQTGVPAGAIFSKGLDAFRGNFSSVYSADGKMLAVAYSGSPRSNTFIAMHHLPSGVHIGTAHISDARVATPIWTSGERLRFATVKPGSITVWEVEFTLIRPPTEVGSLTAPNEIAHASTYPARYGDSDTGCFTFLPTLSRLAFACGNAIFVWDAEASKFILNSGPISLSTPPTDPTAPYFHERSFSSDGHFFVCMTAAQEVYVWEEFAPAGYVLYQKLALSAVRVSAGPLFSPNGESIIISHGSTIHLWPTKNRILPPSEDPTKWADRSDFILEFSQNGMLVVFARRMAKEVTVLDLQSGELRSVIDADMRISCLGVAGDTVVVVGGGEIVTWNLSAGNGTLGTRANISDGVRTTSFQDRRQRNGYYESARMFSISPDLTRIAVGGRPGWRPPPHLEIYNALTGSALACSQEWYTLCPWFTPGGHEVWATCGFSSHCGWKIIEDGESGVTRLDCLDATARPQGGFPWDSSQGYEVTEDGWILSPTKKRLLWLPHRWRSSERFRTWRGQFLGLWDRGLQEVVVLEFFE